MLNEDSNLKDFKDNKDKISYAIDNELMISLYYDDGKPIKNKKGKKVYGNPKAFRRMIPYCLGTRKGRLALRCFHAWKTNTKKGPFKWKFMYLDRMSNVRVYSNMHIPEIPALANPEGDAHMDKIINMIGMKERNQTPLQREREKTQQIRNANTPSELKKATASSEPNKQGAINIRNKGIQNLTPTAKNDFTNVERNVELWNQEQNRGEIWRNYDEAEKARQEQLKQAEAPNPPTSNSGPVNPDDMEGYENNINNKENR